MKKATHVLALVLIALLCSAVALADGIKDPTIIIHGVSGTSPLSHCPPAGCQNVGMNFSFGVPEQGKEVLFFTNASGKNWTSLKLIESGVPAADVSCVQSLFLSCRVTTLKNGSVEILLSGVNKGENPRIGIQAGASFSIGFGCVQGNCWPRGLDFTAQAGAAPEPGTIALLATGLAGLATRRKFWKNRFRS